MRPYQHYPELSVADTYARMQNAVSHQNSGKSCYEWCILPATSKKVGCAMDQRTCCIWSGNTFYNGNAGVCEFSGNIVKSIHRQTGGTSHIQNTLTSSGTTSYRHQLKQLLRLLHQLGLLKRKGLILRSAQRRLILLKCGWLFVDFISIASTRQPWSFMCLVRTPIWYTCYICR